MEKVLRKLLCEYLRFFRCLVSQCNKTRIFSWKTGHFQVWRLQEDCLLVAQFETASHHLQTVHGWVRASSRYRVSSICSCPLCMPPCRDSSSSVVPIKPRSARRVKTPTYKEDNTSGSVSPELGDDLYFPSSERRPPPPKRAPADSTQNDDDRLVLWCDCFIFPPYFSFLRQTFQTSKAASSRHKYLCRLQSATVFGQ